MARWLLTAIVLVGIAASSAAEPAGGIAVIVHPSRQVELSVDLLGQIYLKRKRFWEDGTAIVPLNLEAGSTLRHAFGERVLRQTEGRLAEYWNRQYFYGTLPPVTLASTQAVVRYVAADPNAIGYVPAREVDGSVRVVLRLE